MKQFMIEISDDPDAVNLINYIKSLTIVKKVELFDKNMSLKQKQKLMLETDLKDAFDDVKLMQQGKKKKRTLSSLIDEL